MKKLQVYNQILQRLQFILANNLNWEQYKRVNQILESGLKTKLADCLFEDLLALEQKDPASTGKLALLINTSSAYLAVMTYRVAHQLVINKTGFGDSEEIAFSITEIARRSFGIDINPYANIGHRFVIDHAHGITIGETTVIGNDAYILGGTIIGARGIACNDKKSRHPKIGNNVEIGAYSRLLGSIIIGDNVKISPYSIVTNHIESDSGIKVHNQLQLINKKGAIEKDNITVLITDVNELLTHINSIVVMYCFCINHDGEKLNDIHCYIIEQSKGLYIIKFRFERKYRINELKEIQLQIVGTDTLNGQTKYLSVVCVSNFEGIKKSVSDFLININTAQGELYECAM